MPTAFDATKEYAPGDEVTHSSVTYVNSSDDAVQGVIPPAWPWEAVGTLAVGGQATHQGAVSAPAALTGSTNATAAAATQTASYVQADVQTIATLANSLQATVNQNVADVAALHTTVAALVTAVNALNAALQTGGQEA